MKDPRVSREAGTENFGLYHRSIDALPPPDWFPAPPTFVGIGTQKAGTTWWYRLLEAHPGMFTRHSQKERHYFTRFGQREFTDDDALRYSQLFFRPPGTVSGEWTPGYIAEFWVPPLMAKAAPETKLLVLIREPIARYLSAVRHNLHIEDMKLKLAERDAYAMGRYFAQLSMYLKYFPREQFLLLQYEHCITDPVAQLRRTYNFLGLDPDFVPPNLKVSFNESAGPKFVAPQHAIDTLVGLYKPDVAALKETWPELDLEVWPRFA